MVKSKQFYFFILIGLASLMLVCNPFHSYSQSNSSATLPNADLNVDAKKRHAFMQYDSNYFKKIIPRFSRSKMLSKQLFQLEKDGKATACSHQIKYEIDWLLGSTADFNRIDERLNSLQQSLSYPPQQPQSGNSWDTCITQWFFRVNALYDNLAYLSSQNKSASFVFLDSVNSPEKLTKYLLSIYTSNIAATGVDNRRELNESLANLLRLINNNQPAGYVWHPQLKKTLVDLVLNHLRNKETGYWGEKYAGLDGFVDDLSITFHMISYLDGHVPLWDKVLKHTLAVKNLEYPVGWLHNNSYENHHNMDVVTIFKLGWKHATSSEKQQIQEAIQDMLNWCLAKSLQADGSFTITDDDDSVEEGTYFGVSFLCRVGYFDKASRFWTTQGFDGAEQMRQKVINNILKHKASGSSGGAYYNSAMQQLGYVQ